MAALLTKRWIQPAVRRLTVLLSVVALLPSCRPSHSNRIVIGSKNFAEQLILGELFAQQIERKTNLAVERRFYLAGTYICHQAILAGRIDLYPEYTGTALTAILKEQPNGDRFETYDRVKTEYGKRFGLSLGPTLGFDDTFAIEIRGEDARRLHLTTMSQAAAYAPNWRAGFGYEFRERSDGYRGWTAAYGIRFVAPPRIMDLGLLDRALQDKQVDLIAGNMTDGLIPALDFAVLEDDRHYFPPYEAVPVIRQDLLARHPELGAVFDELSGKISDDDMRQLNYAVEGQHIDVKQVVRSYIERKNL